MKIQVLDHGYVELVECWGTGKDGADRYVERQHGETYVAEDLDFEVGIIEAARQSTQGSFRGWQGQCDCQCCTCRVAYGTATAHEDHCAKRVFREVHTASCSSNKGDAKLLRFLYEHRHSTPFEFSGMVIEVQAPLFVFREWHRHRTQSYNEASARYAPLPDLYYMPTKEVLLDRADEAFVTKNKQSGVANYIAKDVRDIQIANWWHRLNEEYSRCEELYQYGLQIGVPKELARLIMPVGHYSKMRASANLRNWLAFLTLRMDPAAQWEIRQFAEAVAKIVAVKFPRTWELFDEQFKAQS
jgi:thymidylate synthase (FAD)